MRSVLKKGKARLNFGALITVKAVDEDTQEKQNNNRVVPLGLFEESCLSPMTLVMKASQWFWL